MSDNDLSSKLAKGMRRAKEPTPATVTTPATAPRTTPAIPPAASNVAAQSQARAPSGTRPRVGDKRFAEQGDQAPPASLDRPWENLHPRRIWPD